jgi:hypothetical protein
VLFRSREETGALFEGFTPEKLEEVERPKEIE